MYLTVEVSKSKVGELVSILHEHGFHSLIVDASIPRTSTPVNLAFETANHRRTIAAMGMVKDSNDAIMRSRVHTDPYSDLGTSSVEDGVVHDVTPHRENSDPSSNFEVHGTKAKETAMVSSSESLESRRSRPVSLYARSHSRGPILEDIESIQKIHVSAKSQQIHVETKTILKSSDTPMGEQEIATKVQSAVTDKSCMTQASEMAAPQMKTKENERKMDVQMRNMEDQATKGSVEVGETQLCHIGLNEDEITEPVLNEIGQNGAVTHHTRAVRDHKPTATQSGHSVMQVETSAATSQVTVPKFTFSLENMLFNMMPEWEQDVEHFMKKMFPIIIQKYDQSKKNKFIALLNKANETDDD